MAVDCEDEYEMEVHGTASVSLRGTESLMPRLHPRDYREIRKSGRRCGRRNYGKRDSEFGGSDVW